MHISKIIFLLALLYALPYSTEQPDTTTVKSSEESENIKPIIDTPVKKDSIQYESDMIEYDIKKRVTLLTGNAIINYDGITLTADTIHLMFDDKMAVATGSPVLIDGIDTIVGESMVYNLDNKRGRVNYGTAYSSDTKFTGNDISRSTDKSFYVTDGAYTTCSADTMHYCFYSHDIKVIPKDKAISRPVILNIANMPILALPYFIIPLEKGRQSGWLNPKFGSSPLSYAYLDHIGYYWAPNDYTDFTAYGKLDNFSNYLVSANARYALRYKFSGGITGQYAISTNSESRSNEWSINYSHNQNILPDGSMKLSGSGRVTSSSTFDKNNSQNITNLLKQQANANLALSKTFKKIGGTGFVKWNRNQNFQTNITTNDIPTLSFNLNTRPIIPIGEKEKDEIKWFNKIDYSYNFKANQKYISQDFDDGRGKVTMHNTGFSQSIPIGSNFKIFKYLNFSPNINFSHSMFDTYIAKKGIPDTLTEPLYDTLPYDSIVPLSLIPKDSIFDLYTDTLKSIIYRLDRDTTIYTTLHDSTKYGDSDFEFAKAQTFNWNGGAVLSTHLYGIFPIKLFSLTGLRHTLSPSLRYTFRPKSPTAKFDKIFPSIGIGASQQENRQHSLGFSMGNLFEGRVNKKDKDDKITEKKFTLLSSSFSTSYNFTKNDSLDKWDGKLSDYSLSANTTVKFLYFSISSVFRPYKVDESFDYTPSLMNYSISIRPKSLSISGDFWGGNFLIFEELAPEKYMAGINIIKKPSWSFSLSPSYSFSKRRTNVDDEFDVTKTYLLSSRAKINFTHRWSASWSSRYDFVESKFSSHAINLNCNLDGWELKFDWYPVGVNAGSFRFDIRIKKHPEIKWSRRDID